MRRLVVPGTSLLALIAVLIVCIVGLDWLTWLVWLISSCLVAARNAKVTVVLHQTNGNMRTGTVKVHVQLELGVLGISKTAVVALEFNPVEKSVATISGTTCRAIGQLLVNFQCFPDWPDFVGKLDFSIKTK